MPQSPSVTPAACPTRHPSVVIALHWSMCVVILCGVALILARSETGGQEARRWLLDQHRSLGLLALILVMLRWIARRRLGPRFVRHDLPKGLHWASQAVHLALYLLMFATPLLGWALTSARGQSASLFGLIRLPALVAPDLDLADTLIDWHVLSAWTLLALVGVHALAAMWHHLVNRDGILHAMLPLVRLPPAKPSPVQTRLPRRDRSRERGYKRMPLPVRNGRSTLRSIEIDSTLPR